MKIILCDVTINTILDAKVSSKEVSKHINLVYPKTDGSGIIFYDAEVDVTNNEFSISNKMEGAKEYLLIEIHSVGSIQMDVNSFSIIHIY